MTTSDQNQVEKLCFDMRSTCTISPDTVYYPYPESTPTPMSVNIHRE